MDSVKWNKNSKSFTNHLTMSKKVSWSGSKTIPWST
jgi:hypothetical protein